MKSIQVDRQFTALDYVQDGLVAMWDGIENAGFGKHDENLANWINLVGSGEPILLQNHFIYTFDKNSLITTDVVGINTQYKTVPIIASLLNTSEWTIEFMAVTFGKNTALLRTYPWGSGGMFVIERANNVAYLMATDVIGTKLFTGTGDKASGYMASYVLRYKDGMLYRDWRVIGDDVARYDSIEWIKPQMITTNYSIGQNNKYHFIRLYSRALSDEEIAYNYTIDKVRFNIQ